MPEKILDLKVRGLTVRLIVLPDRKAHRAEKITIQRAWHRDEVITVTRRDPLSRIWQNGVWELETVYDLVQPSDALA